MFLTEWACSIVFTDPIYNKIFVQKNEYEGLMFGIGAPELLMVLVIMLIIFGAGKLPNIGAGLGSGIRNFRKAVAEPKARNEKPIPEEIA